MCETVTWGSFLRTDWGWRLTLLTIGILGGGLLIASLIYAYQNMAQR